MPGNGNKKICARELRNEQGLW